MKLSRTSRLITALVALCGMLFMQLAVAAYACPSWSAGQSGQIDAALASAAGMSDMPGCEGMDQEQPALCHAHAHADSQALDKPAAPQIPLFMPLILVAAWQPPEVALPVSAAPPAPPMTRATAPPLSIRNCCFRL